METIVPVTKDGKLKCRFCMKTFWFAKNLSEHLVISHMSPGQIQRCSNKNKHEKVTQIFDAVVFAKTKIKLTEMHDKEDHNTLFSKIVCCVSSHVEPNPLFRFKSGLKIETYESGQQQMEIHGKETNKNGNNDIMDIQIMLYYDNNNDEELLLSVYNTVGWYCKLCGYYDKKFVDCDLSDQLRLHACFDHPDCERIFICSSGEKKILNMNFDYEIKKIQTDGLECNKTSNKKCKQCSECLGNFETVYDLCLHGCSDVRYFSGEPVCPACNRKFHHKTKLMKHVIECHKKSLHWCHVCSSIFSDDKMLLSHDCIKYVNLRSRSCLTCKITFKTADNLFTHRQLKIHKDAIVHRAYESSKQIQSSNCKTCGKCFENQNEVMEHIFRMHSFMQCSVCHLSFHGHQSYFQHLDTCNISNVTHQCTICHVKFRCRETLCIHVTKDHQQSTIQCHFCNADFYSDSFIGHVCRIVRKELISTCSKYGRKLIRKQNKDEAITIQYKKQKKSRCHKNKMLLEDGESTDKKLSTGHLKKLPVRKKSRSGNQRKRRHELNKIINVKHEESFCQLCKRKLSDMESFYKHLSQEHDGVRSCLICRKVYIKEHKCFMPSENSYQCCFCPDSLSSFLLLRKHLTTTHIDAWLQINCPTENGKTENNQIEECTTCMNLCDCARCFVCLKLFPTEADLDCHVKEKHQDSQSQKFKCHLCMALFMSTQNLYNHLVYNHFMPMSESEKKHQESVERKRRKRIRKRKEKNEKYQCTECGENFDMCIEFRRHKALKHSHPKPKRKKQKRRYVKEVKRACPECGKLVTKMRRHMMIHQAKNVKNFVCKQCGKRFSTSYYLKRHTNLHEKKNHMCHKCGKKFTNQFSLIMHELKHVDSDPVTGNIICHICGESLSPLTNLGEHVEGHLEKVNKQEYLSSFQCPICSKILCDKYSLRNHIKLKHKEEKPFKCSTCQKTFVYNFQLKKHIKWMHEKNNHIQCNMCSYKCYMKTSLTRHMKSHHWK